MKSAKWWMAAAFILGVLLGALLVNGVTATATAEPPPGAVPPGWHYHDNHWSYWDPDDKRWYYTNGSNWYYREGDSWRVYPFDKGFGRKDFDRGTYKTPEEGTKLELPRHGVIERIPR